MTKLASLLRRFRRDSDGYITIEVMFMLPVLFIMFGAAWVYFDVFRQQAVNQKANYAIGDMISRETEELDDDYIDSAFKLFGLLTKNNVNADQLTGFYSADLRISVVSYDADDESYSVEWSAARGDFEALAGDDAQDYADHLPVLADAGQVIMVETAEDYNPVFNVGLDALQIKTYSFTSPRYAPQVLFAGVSNGNSNSNANNGFGNGDQDAPGGSLCNNNAENATECSNEDGNNNVEPNRGHGHGRGGRP